MSNPHDPAAVAGWYKCGCEWCQEELQIRGLPLKPGAPAETPKPAKPTNAERDAEIRKLHAAGATIRDLAEEFHLSGARIGQICAKVKREKQEA